MPAVTADGQSIVIDGDRLWIVSGTVAYHRMTREAWPSRLRDARDAGLNCIETPVVWALHEPRRGAFTFEGDLDLTAYIKLIAQHGLHCILRVGPYVGDAYDFGGLPPWLLPECAGRLRSGDPAFLHHVSQFFSAVCDRIRDLQASHGRKVRGPIVAIQNEHLWLCGDQRQAEAYLRETNRFLREHGINIPILAANNLYALAEGEVETWCGGNNLHANMRQLRTVHPHQPRYASHLPTCDPMWWGKNPSQSHSPRLLARRLAEVLAAGAQYNLSPFHGGVNFGFGGGLLDAPADAFVCTSPFPSAPLDDAGRRTPAFHACRRISLFASSFSRLLASLDPVYQPAIISLDDNPKEAQQRRGADSPASQSALVAVERRGAQGSVIFVFAPADPHPARRTSRVLLPDGSSLPVSLHDQPVAWILLDTHLHGRATLDFCSLCALTLVGRTFVCFGPAGAPGLISISGSAFEVIVPDRPEPTITEHEGITVVVCNEQTADATHIAHDAVYVGVGGLDEKGGLAPHPDYRKVLRITADGQARHVEIGPRPTLTRSAPPLTDWALASDDELVSGHSDRYALIDGPATMETLGAPSGYGWVRIRFRGHPGAHKAAFFDAADRLHLYLNGAFKALIGAGPGAAEPIVPLSLTADEQTITALVDNLGRRAAGNGMGEPKGLFGHVWRVAAIRAPAARLEPAGRMNPLDFRSPIFGLEEGEATDPRRITWRIRHLRRTPIYLRLRTAQAPALLVLNDEPIALLPEGVVQNIALQPDQLSRGTNVIQIAVAGNAETAFAHLRKNAAFFEGKECLTSRAQWAFAKWEMPAQTKFTPLNAPADFTHARGRPAWWRARFRPEGRLPPIFLDARGLSKGQIFLNGRNLSRYFVSTRAGRAVPPQPRYYLPESWIKVNEPNELVLFDEHGFSPGHCRLVLDNR